MAQNSCEPHVLERLTPGDNRGNGNGRRPRCCIGMPDDDDDEQEARFVQLAAIRDELLGLVGDEATLYTLLDLAVAELERLWRQRERSGPGISTCRFRDAAVPRLASPPPTTWG